MYTCLCLGVTTHTVQEAIDAGALTWAVRTAEGLVPVCPPRARLPRSAAALLGQHTREVLAER